MYPYQAPQEPALIDAGNDRRFFAYLIDMALLYGSAFVGMFILALGLTILFGSVPDSLLQAVDTSGFGILLFGLYHIGFWCAFGRTPGKMLLGIHVVSKDNPRLGGLPLSASLVRFIAYVVCSFTFGIGFLLNWTNKIPGTRTVRVQRAPAAPGAMMPPPYPATLSPPRIPPSSPYPPPPPPPTLPRQ